MTMLERHERPEVDNRMCKHCGENFAAQDDDVCDDCRATTTLVLASGERVVCAMSHDVWFKKVNALRRLEHNGENRPALASTWPWVPVPASGGTRIINANLVQEVA